MSTDIQSEREHSHTVGFWRITTSLTRLLPGAWWKLPLLFLVGLSELTVLVLLPLTSAKIIDFLARLDFTSFRWALLRLALLTLSQLGVGIVHQYAINRINEDFGYVMRSRCAASVASQPYEKLEKLWIGDLVSRIVNDTSGLKGYLTSVVIQILYDVVTIGVIVVFLLKTSVILGILALATAPVSFVVGSVFQKRIESRNRKSREALAAFTELLQSWGTKLSFLRIFQADFEFLKRFDGRNRALANESLSATTAVAEVSVISAALQGLPSIVILGYGGYQVLQGDLSLGMLFAFMAYVAYFNSPIQRLANIFNGVLPASKPLFERVRDYLNEPVREVSARDRRPVRFLEANNLCFTYSGRERFHLEVGSFEARRGEMVALLGNNGSGKSTAAMLLAGLYSEASGEVFLDGEVASSAARPSSFVLMPAKTVLFDASLLENITLFREPDQARVHSILREVGLEQFATDLPQGWHSKIVAGTGTTLSTGQAQRIGLARALYSAGSVLILDEPGNGLDEAGLTMLKKVLLKEKEQRIVILITHDRVLSAICDRTYEFSQGRVTTVREEQRIHQVPVPS
jgi:ABC-type bacteriocin/lantibiotic exporter with double-glycine peptidase domain